LNASEPEKICNKWIKAKEQFLTGGYILSLQGAKNSLLIINIIVLIR
jgi:hypothetical protein